ncbi:type II toxin-antitoxin system RelE/ParE family toxin [Ramlibacter sp.]|uniref:type II toxin-antitoxin system RelE/ParE family toxin n=1 Tax=Ramlibacter sp. TaxID=1917967 RepID=UPI003D0F7159
MKPARLRPRAELDLVEMASYYTKVSGRPLAQRAFDTALQALELVQRQPKSGSPRLGLICEIPSLRARRVPGFPLQWFYFERQDHLDVVRLLGDRQDIVGILEEGSD